MQCININDIVFQCKYEPFLCIYVVITTLLTVNKTPLCTRLRGYANRRIVIPHHWICLGWTFHTHSMIRHWMNDIGDIYKPLSLWHLMLNLADWKTFIALLSWLCKLFDNFSRLWKSKLYYCLSHSLILYIVSGDCFYGFIGYELS